MAECHSPPFYAYEDPQHHRGHEDVQTEERTNVIGEQLLDQESAI
jgi:hypothetical protein